MDIYSLMHKWTGYRVDSKRKLTLEERNEFLNEISYDAAERIEQWFERNPEALSFDDLFEGKLRKIISLDSADSKKLRHVVEMLKGEGWQIPMHAEWNTPTFQVKSVKHVDTELQGQGGGARSYFKEIANLELEKVEERVIPKGPRAGEKITSRKKMSISKIITRSKVLRKDDKKWWQQKQQYYAKDTNWVQIEGLFNSTVTKSQHVVLSRHPMDILRMSDIDEIESCHSENREYFECAVHEAQGHGPIAYLVDSDQLVDFLNRYAGDEEGDYDLQDEPEERTVWDYGTPEEQIAKIKKYFIENEKLKPRIDRLYRDREHVDFDYSIENRWAVGAKVHGPLMVRVLRNHYEGKPLEADVEGYGETKPTEPKEETMYDVDEMNGMLSSLDDQEVFRDHERDVEGLGAAARVRLRKFEDTENEIQFAVPERIVYGPHPPGFVSVVMDWAWNGQKELFLRDNVQTFFPDASDIGRHGGRWEDTKDGRLLNFFFDNASDFNKERDGYGEHNLRAIGEMDRSDDLETIENQVRDLAYMFDHNHEEKGITMEARVVEMDSWDNQLAFQITSNAKMRLEFDLPYDQTATGRHGDLIPFPEYDSEETITDGKLEKIKSTIIDYGSRAIESLSGDLIGWSRAGGKLYITVELEPEEGGFSSVDDFEYWVAELESYVDGYGEDQPKQQAENMIAERFREMNLFPEENLTVFAKALKGLNEELEIFEMYGVEFDGDEISEIEDVIEIECNFREVFKVSEKLTSNLNKDLLKQMFGPGTVRQRQTAEMHPHSRTTYFTLKPARRGKFSQLLEKRMKKILNKARKAITKDLKNLDPKYDRMKFFNVLRHIGDADYGLKINDTVIDYYIKFEFEKQHTKEFLFGVLDYAKYLDKNITQIDEAFKLTIEEIFADFLEYIKTHEGDQTEDDEESEEKV